MVGLDAILLTSDIADYGRVEEYEEIRTLLATTRHRVLTCPGNHDRREVYPLHPGSTRCHASPETPPLR